MLIQDIKIDRFYLVKGFTKVFAARVTRKDYENGFPVLDMIDERGNARWATPRKVLHEIAPTELSVVELENMGLVA